VPVIPGILSVIFSPSFNEKSFPESLVVDFSNPLFLLTYFLNSSSAALKSNESFLSGKPAPIRAFYPLSLVSKIPKNLDESKQHCTY
jgi:hypothetical protein